MLDSWPTPTRATDSLGRTFEWLRLLGKGGFGEVYLARMRSPSGLEQHVAVKLLPAGLAPDSRSIVRLRDEARLLATLRHPVVLAPHDLAELAGRVALVEEFIEGEDLATCVLPVSTLLEVVAQVASALEVAWSQLRVVHRDVKPQNIRIGRHGNVKLLDFGLASSDVVDQSPRTTTDQVVGTTRYLAPERFEPRRDPTPASDVYALGCVLYDGIAGVHLLEGRSLPEVVQLFGRAEDWDRFVAERLTPLRPEHRELIGPLLAHDSASRPTAGEVRERCEALIAADPQRVSLARWCRDRQWADTTEHPPHVPLTVPFHLASPRLASSDLTPDEDAHLSSCVQCRSARRLLLQEWMLGRYRVLGRIGRGGMSDVYAAARPEDGQKVALKVLRDRRPGLARRVSREAEHLRSVESPHVLPLVELFEHDAGPVLVLPFVEGPTLAAVLDAHPAPLPTAWFAAIVDGVAAIHRANRVHRDLKPANVLLDPASGVVVPKLMDLGLAKSLQDDGASLLTRSGMLLGTPAYTAPEQLASASDAGPRADVWSLGVLLVEMLTGQCLRAAPDDLPAPWGELARKLLQPDPEARPVDAAAVAALLPPVEAAGEEWVARCRALAPKIEPAGADRPRGTVETPLDPTPVPIERPARGIGTVAVLAGALVAVALGLLVLRADRADPPPEAPPSEAPAQQPPPVAEAATAEAPTALPLPAAPVEQPTVRKSTPPVAVWVKTRPWGHVTVGAQRWTTEDRSMRLPPGRHVLRLDSHDGSYQTEVVLDVVADGENRLCWDFPTGAPCSR